MNSELFEELKRKEETGYYADMVYKDNSLAADLIGIAKEDPTAVKYTAEKTIRYLSEKSPELVYPYFDKIAELLDSGNKFIKWGAVITLPNLLANDTEGKWEGVSKKYIGCYRSCDIVEFSNAVESLPKILKAYPSEEKNIMPFLLNVDSRRFMHKGEYSRECVNVAKEKVIDCFILIYEKSPYKAWIKDFVIECRENERKQVRTKTKRFWRKYGYREI